LKNPVAALENMTNYPEQNHPSSWAKVFGYGGLIPFVGLALAMSLMDPTHQTFIASALLAYSATIVSFLGAIHWGLTMRDASCPKTAMLTWGVVPSLVAWVALLLPTVHGLLLMAIMLWLCFAVDRAVYPQFGIKAWLPMRLMLTLLASLSCVATTAQLTGFVI
jgi:hypothetical protein